MKMQSLDHRCVKQDGPPDLDVMWGVDTSIDEESTIYGEFLDEEPTHVDGDGIVDTIIHDTRVPWTPYP